MFDSFSQITVSPRLTAGGLLPVERERETERERDRETERERETETDRERETETDRRRQRQRDRETQRERQRQRQRRRQRQRQRQTEVSLTIPDMPCPGDVFLSMLNWAARLLGMPALF